MDCENPSAHVPGAMPDQQQTVLQQRLSALLEARKEKPAPLGKRLGLSDSFIRDILRGKTKSPRAESLELLATELGTTSDYLLGRDKDGELTGPAIVRSGRVLPFAGEVQAGYFTLVNDEYFNQDPQQVPPHVLPDASHSRVRQYAWQARGGSMDAAGIHDGMWVVGADAADYIDVYGDIQTGDLVVVERTRNNGQERELTVKEVHFFRDRYELRPVSSDPSFETIVVPHNHSVDGWGMEVKIIGVVLTAYANLKRRR